MLIVYNVMNKNYLKSGLLLIEIISKNKLFLFVKKEKYMTDN